MINIATDHLPFNEYQINSDDKNKRKTDFLIIT